MIRTGFLSTLMDHETPLEQYLSTAFLVATVPAIIIANIAAIFTADELLAMQEELIARRSDPLSVLFIKNVVTAPLLETGMMGAIFFLARSLGASPALQVGLQTAIWSVLHGVLLITWAFPTAWLFFVFAVVWLTQERASLARAFGCTFAVHAMNNSVAMVFVALERTSG